MIVQKQQQQITTFLSSPQSIFLLSPLDFPNPTQQTLILSYLSILPTLSSPSSSLRSFQQLSFNRPKTLQKIIIGLTYRILLHPSQHQALFQLIKQLGSHSLDFFSQFIIHILNQQTDKLKEDSLMAIPPIYQQLIKYNLYVQKLTVNVLRTINYIDLSERGLTYSYHLVEVLLDVIEMVDREQREREKEKGEDFGGGIKRLVFMKTLRLLTSIYPYEQEPEIRLFVNQCKKLLLKLWELNQRECLFCGAEAFRFLPDFLSHPQLRTLFQQYKLSYYSHEKQLLHIPRHKYDQLLAITIPIEIFDAIGFCLNSSPSQIYYQMSWFQKLNRDNKNYQILLVDILRYMVKIVQHQNTFTFITWILNYSDTNKQISVMFKHLCLQAIFFDWFFNEEIQDELIVKRAECGLYVLRGYQGNSGKFQQMLEFIVFQQIKQVNSGLVKVKGNLWKIFKLAEERGLFGLRRVLEGNFLDGVVKEELKRFVESQDGDKNGKIRELKGKDKEKQKGKGEYEIGNKQTQERDIVWEKDIHNSPQTPILITPPPVPIESIPQKPKPQQQILGPTLNLPIQKYYYQQTKQCLLPLLSSPTLPIYSLYLSSLIPLLKKHYQNKQLFQRILIQSSKLLYTLFQSNFQSFYSIPPQQNIISLHIQTILKYWGSSDLILDIYRKILRGVIRLFPIGIFAVYFVFLMTVPSTKAYCQEVSAWVMAESKGRVERGMSKFLEEEARKTVKVKAGKYKVVIQ